MSSQGQGSGLYLSHQAALGFHVQLHFMPLIIQEILQLQEFEGTQTPLVPPEHGQLQFPSLEGEEVGHHWGCPRSGTPPPPPGPAIPHLAHPFQLQSKALVPGIGATRLP